MQGSAWRMGSSAVRTTMTSFLLLCEELEVQKNGDTARDLAAHTCRRQIQQRVSLPAQTTPLLAHICTNRVMQRQAIAEDEGPGPC